MTASAEKERAEFEAWLGIKPCGAAHDLAWAAWQAASRRARERGDKRDRWKEPTNPEPRH